MISPPGILVSNLQQILLEQQQHGSTCQDFLQDGSGFLWLKLAVCSLPLRTDLSISLLHQHRVTLGYNLVFQTQPLKFLSWGVQRCLPSTWAPDSRQNRGTAGHAQKVGWGLLLTRATPPDTTKLCNAHF